MKINSKLLKDLLNTYGPTGRESKVAQFIMNELKDYASDMIIDKMGNLIVHVKGEGPKVMIAAHMDSIGMMVTRAEDNGTLRSTNIGGMPLPICFGSRFIFENGTQGVMFAKPKADFSKLTNEDMFIDIFTSNKEDALTKVKPGDIAVYKSEYYETDTSVTSMFMDDRIACYILIEAIKELKNPKNDCYFVFTVQEEVGLRGAKTATSRIDPDYGIAVDITGSFDTVPRKDSIGEFGKGPAIKIKDGYIVVNPKINEFLYSVCKDNNITYQNDILASGGTDAGAIHLNTDGVLATTISICTRYGHTPQETVNKKDVLDSIKLLVNALQRTFDA